MKYQTLILPLVLPALLLSALAFGAVDKSKTDKDNTRVNKRDREATELTADNQTSSTSDMNMTRRIRQEIMKETSFSTYAQNVKVITVGGKVTVKGPVRSEQELSTIMKLARQVAGAMNVKNEMAVEIDQ